MKDFLGKQIAWYGKKEKKRTVPKKDKSLSFQQYLRTLIWEQKNRKEIKK